MPWQLRTLSLQILLLVCALAIQEHPIDLRHAATRRQVYREVRALVAPVIPDRSGTKFPVLPQVSSCRAEGSNNPSDMCCRGHACNF